MFFEKVVAETPQYNDKGAKILVALEKELDYLKGLSPAKLKKYSVLGSELEKSLLKCKAFPYLAKMKEKPTYKNGVNRYEHTLDFLKGLLAISLGEKGEALFISFDEKIADPREQSVSSNQYKKVVAHYQDYLQDPEMFLLLIAITITHEAGNADKWDPRHFDASVKAAAGSFAALGYFDGWYELGCFLVEKFCYFRDLLLGEASVEYQKDFRAEANIVFPEKYQGFKSLSELCKLLTIIDLNASHRIFLTKKRLVYIENSELDENGGRIFEEAYNRERLGLLREDLTGLNIKGVEMENLNNLYFRYLHTIVHAKRDDDDFLFSTDDVRNLLISFERLERHARITLGLDFKYIILEKMSINALHNLRASLLDKDDRVRADIKIINDSDLYFFDYQVFVDGDYLVIYNR